MSDEPKTLPALRLRMLHEEIRNDLNSTEKLFLILTLAVDRIDHLEARVARLEKLLLGESP